MYGVDGIDLGPETDEGGSSQKIMLMTCEQETVFCSDVAHRLLPPRLPGKVRANYLFVFSTKPPIRLRSVEIETNLAPLAASANIPLTALAKYEPRARVVLEFEVLFSAYIPDRASRAESKLMVRSRLIRFFDDADTGYGSSVHHSWLTDAVIFAPEGVWSGQVGSMDPRWYFAWPWVYTIIEPPKRLKAWWPKYVRACGLFGRPQVLTLAHGFYAPEPQEWPLQRYRREKREREAQEEKQTPKGTEPGGAE